MEKMFNFISVIGGLVGGFIVSLFGGWDVMLYTILLFAILDYFTGILKAVYKKELSSAIGFKGIVKKIMVFVVIAVAYNVQRMTGDTIPLREIVIVFFICNEALSILENAAEFKRCAFAVKGQVGSESGRKRRQRGISHVNKRPGKRLYCKIGSNRKKRIFNP